ncbi:Fur family transcriptional regulator [Haliovirga abyssi]|uniref:Transcriptional repressor n=1 Tax=Haliovirga abyssi TaxID=2996794 RepID=A0AAU9DXG3_9FUSO|nr:Fur family transcriptional regulator [Haliovirga abyssi]BDU51136.1 transcriptional repressor [Haliovirga abyssi]
MGMIIKDVSEYLKSHDIKPSYQRMKIFNYLITKKNHPTVDQIYKELVEEIPTLSKTTVYNTLKLFVDKKIAIIITIEENETRYDADISLHGHFKCTECGQVYDVNIEVPESFGEGLKKFQIDEEHIYFKGICEECLKKRNGSKI